ncbi:hypothetical protein [Pseudonocardia sp. MH-G8]|uniref:hypothetical protein n=1 Tax=Pseudonocardia sp. MH-G8 TaxID=1854588 RepID=UPI000BA12457|nr:hypothetical protein [Pseudonocardia sp. MH-G8]OZM79342.1 hypothetical protein CFP66_26740 [Pseudonocardia sp. MH-G8]
MKVLSPSTFVALYGSFRPHPWITMGETEEDAYSLFFNRAEMMGWSHSTTEGRRPVLWGMNDAGFDVAGETTDAGRVAWFQVGTGEDELSGVAFPFHPLLTCAVDSVARVGQLGLDGVQFLVPVQYAGAPAFRSAVPNWFNLCDPASRTRLRVTVDSGEDAVLPRVAAKLSELVTLMAPERFAVEPGLRQEHVQLLPEATEFWMGEGRHPVTFDTVAPDWTLDSIAYTADLFAEACRRIEIRTSVQINIGRR